MSELYIKYYAVSLNKEFLIIESAECLSTIFFMPLIFKFFPHKDWLCPALNFFTAFKIANIKIILSCLLADVDKSF